MKPRGETLVKNGMGLFRLLILLGALIFVVVGLLFWANRRSVDPFKLVRDGVTRYQSGHPRHDFDASRRVRWDPIGDHNAAVEAMDPEDRAYPLLAEVYGLLWAVRTERGQTYGLMPDFINARPGEPGWEELVAWLDDERVLAVRVLGRAAASKPALGAPLAATEEPEWHAAMARHGIASVDLHPGPQHPLLISALLPALGPVRGLSEISNAVARLCAERGDVDGFMAAIDEMFDLAVLSAEPGFVINQVVRADHLARAARRIGETLAGHPELLDEAAAARLARRLGDAIESGWTRLDTTRDLQFFEDILRRTVDDRGVFNRSMARRTARIVENWGEDDPPPPSSAPLEAFNPDLLASYHEMARYAAARAEAARVPWRPFAIGQAEIAAWVSKTDSIPGRTGRELVGRLMLEMFSPEAIMRTTRQHVLGVQVALAAHRHHLRHGGPPSSLDAIDADLLGFEAVDGFTGGRLVYRWTGEGHLVYALGADGDDDGGRHALDPEGEPVPHISDAYLTGRWDGDWVAFPPRD